MTREEAIGKIEYIIDNGQDYGYWTDAQKKAFNMAKEALQHEQERREDIYECPNCIGEVHKNYIYCPFCGKKVNEGHNNDHTWSNQDTTQHSMVGHK